MTNKIYKCPVPPQGSTVADLAIVLGLDIGTDSYKNMITSGGFLYVAKYNASRVVQKRNCSDLTLVSSTVSPFNGSDTFSDIVGITVFSGVLYVLEQTRIVKFDTETMLYDGEVLLPDPGSNSRQAIDNDGTHVYITVRGAVPV